MFVQKTVSLWKVLINLDNDLHNITYTAEMSTPSIVVAVVSTAAASITITALTSLLIYIIVIHKCIYKKFKAEPKPPAYDQDDNYDNIEFTAKKQCTV